VSLAWPLVATLALVLGYLVALRALRSREGRYATAEEQRQLRLDFLAFTEATARRFEAQDESIRKLDARTGDARVRQYPAGLRAGP
jgi:hypothetical protein